MELHFCVLAGIAPLAPWCLIVGFPHFLQALCGACAERVARKASAAGQRAGRTKRTAVALAGLVDSHYVVDLRTKPSTVVEVDGC